MWQRFFLIILVIIILLFAAACAPAITVGIQENKEAANLPTIHEQRNLGQRLPAMQSSRNVEGPTHCVDPTPSDEQDCAKIERQILASTVRFEISGPDISDHKQRSGMVGHGTVKDGRYLVVHNHFSIDLTVFADESYANQAHISMYNGIGDLFAWEARPPLFTISRVEPETLILDFGTDSEGEGFFESMGLQSATLSDWQEETPSPGQEVAQVVWDYRKTTIDWVLIDKAITVDGVPRVILSSSLLAGASGGGVFWNGYHIAVNWQTGRVFVESGEILEQFSIAALNSNRLVSIP